MPNPRPTPVVLLALLVSDISPRACFSSSGGDPRTALPSTISVDGGVVIANGNDLPPPFTLAVENDTLWIYDGVGRRFASSEPSAPRTGFATELPLPRLLTRSSGVPPDDRGGADLIARTHLLTIEMAQLAHLLAGGGLLAFGHSYVVAFPAARATTVAGEMRWVIAHAPELWGLLPHAHPLLRDLLWPTPPPPPSPAD